VFWCILLHSLSLYTWWNWTVYCAHSASIPPLIVSRLESVFPFPYIDAHRSCCVDPYHVSLLLITKIKPKIEKKKKIVFSFYPPLFCFVFFLFFVVENWPRACSHCTWGINQPSGVYPYSYSMWWFIGIWTLWMKDVWYCSWASMDVGHEACNGGYILSQSPCVTVLRLT